MKNLFVALLGLLAVSASATSANASAFATSLMQVSSARLVKQVGNGWVPATSTDISSITGSPLSTTKASYSGSSVSNMSLGTFNAPRSFRPSGLSSPLNSENNFGTNSKLQNYSLADTNGGGTFIAPAGVGISTLADINGIGNELGEASANVSVGGSFVVRAPGTLNPGDLGGGGLYKLVIEATGRLEVSSLGSLAKAGFGFGANINSTIVGTAKLTDFSPAFLNQVISGVGLIEFYDESFESNEFTLASGVSYSFNINQGSTASIASVPEPTSMVVVGILGIAGFATRIRRKQ